MTKALVLGATGFIGGHIAKKAIEAGWEVHGFRRNPQSTGQLEGSEIQWHNGTLEDYPSLVDAMRGMDYVFHAAANYPGDGNPALVEGHILAGINQMENVIRGVREAGVKRLIYTSSLTTIGLPPRTEERLADERDFYRQGSLPDNGYYEVKIAMEKIALEAAEHGDDIVIINPALVLGPGDVHLSTGEILVMIAEGKAIGVPPGTISIIDARDAAEAQINAARNGRAGERYILGGGNYSIMEAAGTIARIAGVSQPKFTIPSWVVDLYIGISDALPFIPFPHDHVRAYRTWQGYDTSKARKELDLKSRPLEETARDSISWFRERGYL
ncbi:MAG: NAD-dependent epimerase/dehydratase family protein [Anaerolineales bacterium]